MKIIILFIKLFFVTSIVFFLLALLITDSWVPELVATLSAFHTLSTIVFIALFFLLRLKPWLIGGGAFFIAQTLFLVVTHLNSSPFVQPGSDEVITIAQYNVHYLNRNVKGIVDWLEDNQAHHDIVFLQEVNMSMKRELQRLKRYYPYKVSYGNDHFFGRAFLSKVPITSHRLEYYNHSQCHYLVLDIKTRQGKNVKFYGLHTTAPLSSNHIVERNQEFAETDELVAKDPSEYKILAGDFNVSPYSTTFRKTLKTTGLKRPRRLTGSWPAAFPIPALRIQIDHILVSRKIDYLSQKCGEDIGSDHLPVITKLALKT